MRSPANSRTARFRSSRRSRSRTEARLPPSAAFGLRSTPSAAGARRNSKIARRWNGSVASSAESMPWAASRRSRIAPHSTSPALAKNRASIFWRTTSCRRISCRRGPARSRRRWMAFAAASSAPATWHRLRLHGDCHAGNILWTADGPHFVDFDDCRTGPAVQDLWMLLSGDRADAQRQLRALLRGYEDFCEFDDRELQLVEALRTLRLIHYSAWLARRWDRSGVSGGVSVVQHAALLAGPRARIARADRGDGRAGAGRIARIVRPVQLAGWLPRLLQDAVDQTAASDRCAPRVRGRASR